MSRIEEIKARRAAISSPPWTDEFYASGDSHNFSVCSIGGEHSEDCPKIPHCHQCVCSYMEPENARFVAHAPDDIDFLLELLGKYVKI